VDAHHRERMAGIERGVDVPPLPESFYQPIQRRPRREGSTLLPGLIWLFVGIGLFVALAAVAKHDVQYFALIPSGIGLAYLIYHFVEGRKLSSPVANAGEVKGSR
jgi:hypothetical protein